MKEFRTFITCFFACFIVATFLPLAVLAQVPHPETYIPTITAIEKHKSFYADDPRPFLLEFGPKQVLPKALYDRLCYDVEKMKSSWAEVVGFRAPDVVGKIAPEIKPGKYTYKDLDKHPGFKQLMYPDLYNRIKPGGPPFAGNIPEFEITPTSQYYWSLPIAEATKRNDGKAKLDNKGYLISETWESGFPFPRPSGDFKAQQIMCNVEKRYISWGLNFYIIAGLFGYNKDLKMDFNGRYEVRHIRLAGRTLMEPYGWFDKRAKDRGELKSLLFSFLAPRDIAGAAQQATFYLDPNKADQLMMYIPSFRRVRKMTATDSQDPIMGQDAIWDDTEGWNQKLSPTRYPYKFEVLEEREYLVHATTLDGSEYCSSKGMEFRNVKLERRPIYVLKMTQLDRNYVYGHRIFFIDKETFNFYHVANYDQKGRLYRTWDQNWSFFPDMGMFSWSGILNLSRDHLDLHSTLDLPYQLPAFWNRDDVSVEGFIKQK